MALPGSFLSLRDYLRGYDGDDENLLKRAAYIIPSNIHVHPNNNMA